MPRLFGVLINIGGNAGLIASLINPRVRVCGAGWQPIKHYAWGVVAFDPKEGIRLETTTDGLVRCVRWFRRWAAKHDFPIEYGGASKIIASLTDLSASDEAAPSFDDRQWKRHCEVSWALRAEPAS